MASCLLVGGMGMTPSSVPAQERSFPSTVEGVDSGTRTPTLPGLSPEDRRPIRLPGLEQQESQPLPKFSSESARLAYVLFQARRAKELQSPELRRQMGISTAAGEDILRLADTLKGIEAELRRRDVGHIDSSMDRYEEIARTLEAKIAPLLSEAQRIRLLGTVISQQRGTIVFLFPGVAEVLSLNQDQQTRIEAIASADLKAVRNAGPLQIPGLIRQTNESRSRIENLLTPAQRQRWHALSQGKL